MLSLRKLGRYEIVRVLGKGAMGIVYEGRDPNLDRRVAIKTVKVENLSPEAAAEYEARFRTEARSAARLQHPNIVSVYDSDRHDDVAYLVMEYIQGDDLKHHLDSGARYSLEQTLHMIDDLLSALDYAHRNGVVHRDIKPANLLIEASGRVKLTDFGVARLQDAGDATRTQGAMIGTLKYMAPEQVQGQRVDTRADLFSVGVVLYQLLTDQRPFGGDNEFEIIQQIVGRAPTPPSSIDARLPTAIDAVVARALAKRPDERFATAADFAAALRAAMRQVDDVTIVPPVNPARSQPGYRSSTSPGTSPMGTATVTQELELVYWKDVKDSTDADDLNLFLSKFPAGIYAELARRRLRKLGTAPAPDQTVLSGIVPETDRTIPTARTGVSAPAREPLPVGAARSPRDDPAALEETTLPLPRRKSEAAPSARSPGAAASAPTDAPEPPVETTVPLPREGTLDPSGTPSSGHKVRPAVLAGAAALAVAAAAAFMLLGRGGGEAPTTAASAPASAAAASAAPAPTESQVMPPATATVAHAAASAPATAAAAVHALPVSAPRAPASAPRGRQRLLTKATPVPATGLPSMEPPRPPSEPAAPELRELPRPSAPAPRVVAASPVDVCKDKMFLSLEFCLAQQCDKPGTRNHPLCVKRREEVRLREESKIRN